MEKIFQEFVQKDLGNAQDNETTPASAPKSDEELLLSIDELIKCQPKAEDSLQSLHHIFLHFIKNDVLQRRQEKERMRGMELIKRVLLPFSLSQTNA